MKNIATLPKKMMWVSFFLLLMILFVVNPTWGDSNDSNGNIVITVMVEDTVTAGTANLLSRAIRTAEEEQAEALIVLINTPGGLVTATLDMIQDMLGAQVPIITYVYPQGAIAASAGTFILIGGNIAAMAPGTTCGAAMPVMVAPTGEGTQAADEKTINFLAGHMKSIAQERGRSVDVAERFVTENLTLNYNEALDLGIVDFIAPDLSSLMEMVDGLEVELSRGVTTLETKDAQIVPITMTTAERITHFVSDPQVTFILFLLGIYGLIIGFNSPGTFFPEVMGAICLIMALYGLGLFEVNILAGLLIIVGVGLIVAEAFTPTYGILGLGGVICIVLGSVFLPVEPMLPADWFVSFRMVAIGLGIVSGILVVILLSGIIRLRRVKKVHGDQEFADTVVVVAETIDPTGMVKIKGELWNAIAEDGMAIMEGENVVVLRREGMNLVVKKSEKE